MSLCTDAGEKVICECRTPWWLVSCLVSPLSSGCCFISFWAHHQLSEHKISCDWGMPHAVMGRKLSRVALGFLLFHVFLGASSAVNFVSEPPPTRSHVGDDITIEWTLNSNPADFSLSTFLKENDVSIISHAHGGVDTPGPGYEGRVSFYNTSSRGVGFRLTDVMLSDAGRYRCRYEYPQQIDSSLSVLFIFGQPSTPVISLKRCGQISDPFTGDLKDGDSVTLLCAASSTSLPEADRPAMTYTWTKDGQPIDRNTPPDRHSVPNDSGRRLDISPVSRDDNVIYSCTAREEGSNLNSQTTHDLNVLYPPGAATAPDPLPSPMVQGALLAVTCSLSDPGNPPASVVYMSPKGQHHTPLNNRLVISDVTLERDDGTWDCYGTNTAGTTRDATFDITVYVPPGVVRDLPPTEAIDITQTLSVWCSFQGRPQPAIQWTYNGSASLPDAVETVPGEATGDKLVTSSSTLQWKTSSDSQRRRAGGVYRCTATNAAGNVTSREMTLDAQYAPYSVTVTPSSPVTTVEGERLVLEGHADCNPPCQYSWTLNRDSLTPGTSGRLQIDSISRDKHGTYSLRAYNDLGGLTENVVVNVNYPPTVTMTIDPQDGSRGDTVDILCQVDSRPHSQVTWTNVTGSGIPRGTLIAGQRQSTLILDPADCLDSGTIRCTADNSVTPTASKQRDLNVFCPPRLDSARQLNDRHGVGLREPVTFEVYVIANPAPESWTYTLTTENGSTHNNNVNGVALSPSGNPGNLTIASVQPHHYGDYDVTVTNNEGQPLDIQLQLEKTGPPESPEEFKVRDVTCASVTLQWEAGFSGGSPQTFYLSYRTSGAAEWGTETVQDLRQDVFSHKVNNLEELTSYEFKLYAKNADGNTEDNVVRSTAETTACPKFVDDSLVISVEDNIATISWQFTQRVDRVEVKCCNDPAVCTNRSVDQPITQQPITMEVPPGNQNYIFTFKLFQDGELVFSMKKNHDPENNAAIIAAVTTTVIVVIIVIVVVIVVIALRQKRRVSKRDATPLYENTAYQNDRSATDAVQHKSTETGAATEFEASQVEIQTLLSDGTGFQVYSAQVQIGRSLHAAVIKRVKDAASLEVYSRYLADQMSVLLSLKHVNVVKLLGFQRGCGGEYENEASMSSLSLVLEPATQGDLHTFLTGHGAGVYQKTVTMETMMGMALGVATGAHALSDNKPAALHHYVCAKHVLVDDRGVCKLTGFSTAEAVRAREEWEAIHKSERPVRWMSAETLNHLEHTTKSDVWSFAIFLWELFSLGEMPYPGLEDDEVQTAIQDGNRLEKPNNCDPTTYDLMAECWIRNTERRPGFQYVMNCLMKYQSEKTNASADEHTYEAVV